MPCLTLSVDVRVLDSAQPAAIEEQVGPGQRHRTLGRRRRARAPPAALAPELAAAAASVVVLLLARALMRALGPGLARLLRRRRAQRRRVAEPDKPDEPLLQRLHGVPVRREARPLEEAARLDLGADLGADGHVEGSGKVQGRFREGGSGRRPGRRWARRRGADQ
eukprot:gene5560-biopygen10917